jgi:hypothetical protein
MNCFYKRCLWKTSKDDGDRIIGNVDGCTSVMGEKVLILLAT